MTILIAIPNYSIHGNFATKDKALTPIYPKIKPHTHTHTCIYIYIYICVCVCVCATFSLINMFDKTPKPLNSLNSMHKD